MRITGEFALTPEELSGLFEAKGWKYHTDRGLTVPTEGEIEVILTRLVAEVLDDGEAIGIQGGRLMVWKDPELPNSYDLFLNIGFVWDDDALDDEGSVAA
ncbi:hypothetical protein [Nonomuraea sp. NPDC049129]|uniref:hypothetical protein n=1 Tax=Nonomuraea sp. NPDC049129 TaxID=3155272 RepID=UPI003400E13C